MLEVLREVIGLKVNYNRSLMAGFNMEEQDIMRSALLFECQVKSFPFTYLGLPLSSGPLRLMRQSVPLETMIRDELSAKQPSVYDWFWSQQYPAVVTTFVNLIERDPQFAAATAICWKGVSSGSSRAHDLSLLMLALSCIAAVTKLGPAKVSCIQFFSIVPDVTGRLMDMLVESVPIWKAYHSAKDIGLRREFLLHFGSRAASCRVKNDQGVEEISFWVELIQKQLQRGLDREKIWSRLTTCESIEVCPESSLSGILQYGNFFMLFFFYWMNDTYTEK
ncbi:hypothetical protein Taro_010084 [Colocasia esculenta]|uniref:Uncharacterized protein n=1 Tax=Colocasia esculenta TaxID=4460 RepID=A0A843U2B0_COLES|nr:hypothetical protein [Colocasia esculenta]